MSDLAGLLAPDAEAPDGGELGQPVDVDRQPAGQLDQLRRWAASINIAPELDDSLLGEIAQRVAQDWKIDDDSRADWKAKFRLWMNLATQVAEAKTYPWPGASNVLYPLMTVAAIQFSARAYPAIVRGREVVKGVVDGDDDGQPMLGPDGKPVVGPQGPQWVIQPGAKLKRAERIGHHMSFQILHEMDDWEEETDRLMLTVSITGSMFRKVYYDSAERKNASRLVEPLRLCVNYKAPSFKGAARITEEIDLFPWEIEANIRAGVFVDQVYSPNHDMTMDLDAPITFLEQHRRWDLDGDGYAEPYIVTVARDSTQIARIVAGYDEDTVILDPDGRQVRRIDPVQYYVKYAFVPNPDSAVYDLGFGALLYPVNSSINTTLNQMFDAGHLANAGGGFIGSGMSMNTGNVTFGVGEYKVVNTPGATLRENLVPLNFTGPNQVLFQLLEFLVNAGKEIASIKDVLSGEMPGANVPGILGLAVIQQGLKVFSAIFKRIHRSLAAEYKMLFRLNRLYLPNDAGYRMDRQYFRISRQDYERAAGVEPASDPEVVTDIQQMARANFLLQFANDPFFDGLEIRRRALEAANIPGASKLLRAQPLPNPEIIAKQAELHLRALRESGDLDIRRSRDKAAEVRDLAQSILALAQARKADHDVDLGWIDRNLKALEIQLDALTAGGSEGNPGGAASGAPGPVGPGLPGMAASPGLGGVPPVPGGFPG